MTSELPALHGCDGLFEHGEVQQEAELSIDDCIACLGQGDGILEAFPKDYVLNRSPVGNVESLLCRVDIEGD